MFRSRRPLTLVELIQRGRRKQGSATLRIPKWWRNNTSAPPDDRRSTASSASSAEAEVCEDVAPTVEPPHTAAFGGAATEPGKLSRRLDSLRKLLRPSRLKGLRWPSRLVGPAVQADRPPRILWYADGRLHLSLNVISTAVAICGILLLAFAACELGYKLGIKARPVESRVGVERSDEIAKVRSAKANSSVLREPDAGVSKRRVGHPSKGSRSGQQGSAPRVKPVGGRFRRTVGLNYIIVQYFTQTAKRDAWVDARDAKDYLDQQGIETAIAPTTRGCKLVAKTRGFDLKNPKDKAECEALQERIRRLGQAYAKMGDYDLSCTVEKAREP